MSLLKRLIKQCVFLGIGAYALSAQNEGEYAIIKGKIVDEITNEPLLDALVQIKGTEEVSVTDSAGYYEIKTKALPPFILNVSYEGYQTKDVDVYEVEPELNIPLRIGSNSLSTVVIVGYGTQTKQDLVGSVSKLDPAETKVIPEAGFDSQMQGKASGVQINTNTGVPGSDVFIRVRGATSINASNEPLYVIDGVFINNTSLQGIAQERKTSPLADINPSDIESIEILKDANATAIYGSRGANGVVIVTTKRGNFEQKPKIEFNTSQGWAWAPKERIWKTTTGPEHAMLVNEYNANMGRPLPFRPINEVIDGVPGRGLPSEQPTYDRMAILNRVAHLQSYDLSVQGGSKSTKYYVGGGYNKQESIWKPMSFDRASLKVNLDQKINSKVSIGVSNTLSRSFRNQARPANGGLGTLLQSSLNVPTYLPIYLPDGTPAKWVNFDNIVVLTERVNLKSTSLHYIGNFYTDVDILPNLKFRTTWSVDYNNYDESEYWQRGTVIGGSIGKGTSSITQSSAWVNEQTLHYSNTFKKKHHFGALLGNTLQANTIKNTTASGTNFPNDSYTLISQASVQTAKQGYTQNRLASFFGRIDYNYNKRYYIEGTLRADGSSKFGQNNKWGYFPSIGAAWRIKEERFLSDVKFLSNLKLRGSYGITGNQGGIPDFPNQGLWNGGYGYPTGNTGGEQAGTAPYQLANPDLKWEGTKQANAGVDIGLLKDRINIEFNVYHKYTTDLLVNVPVPGRSGYTSILTNYGEMSNRGFEFAIAATNIKTKEFTWRTDFNVSRNINRVEKIPRPILYAGRDLIRLEEGQPLYSYWLYKQLYVDPQTGNAVFEDINKDGLITAADRQTVGNTWPKFFGGLTNTFSYKGFDLSALITYQYGNDVWNHNRMLGETGGTIDANRVLLASQLERWTTPGQVTDVPRLTAENYSRQESSRFFEDGSFIRLRSVNLGYTLPKKLTQKARVQTLKLYVSASNLVLITKYKGSDPETNMGGEQNIQGYDYALPPQPRSFQIGLNV
ncbi:MAG TPA: TonB-dependent receptor, partial [Cytophagales bacterium]|nr:TonB-dependent receptor [Cytophagales bacterium]